MLFHDFPCSNLLGQKESDLGEYMEVNVQPIHGNWDLGYSLDKHVLSSVYLGDD